MSHHHLNQHTNFLHYTPPNQHGQQQPQQHQHLNITYVSPKDTQRQPAPAPAPPVVQHPPIAAAQPVATTSAQASASAGPLVARGDWTKDLVQLAKTAELKKHALTLQLHTAHILSAHASLEQKGKAIQDLREQKNKLESERTRLLNSLREVNEDRDKVDLMESKLEKECQDTRTKINQLTDGDYATAKADVDRLRIELGQPPLPSLQNTLEEKTTQYLNERRLNGNEFQSQPQTQASGSRGTPAVTPTPTTSLGTPINSNKRSAPPTSTPQEGSSAKRPRGRPKGSKNKNKVGGEA